MREFRSPFIVSVVVLHCILKILNYSVSICGCLRAALTRSAQTKAKSRETSLWETLYLKSRATFQNFLSAQIHVTFKIQALKVCSLSKKTILARSEEKTAEHVKGLKDTNDQSNFSYIYIIGESREGTSLLFG